MKPVHKIRFIKNTFGNRVGDETVVIREDTFMIYYYDRSGEYSFIEKDFEGQVYENISNQWRYTGQSGVHLPNKTPN